MFDVIIFAISFISVPTILSIIVAVNFLIFYDLELKRKFPQAYSSFEKGAKYFYAYCCHNCNGPLFLNEYSEFWQSEIFPKPKIYADKFLCPICGKEDLYAKTIANKKVGTFNLRKFKWTEKR